MIVYDARFLNDESMLKMMLRIFERRIIRTSCLRSISWVVSSLSFRREARDVCVCVYVCLCVWERMRIKSVVCEKSLSFVEFKDFCSLRSILEFIVRAFVNIKKEERNLLRWRNSNIFYSILFFKHFLFQSYFNLNCYFSSWNSWRFTFFVLSFCFFKIIVFHFFFFWVVLCLWIDVNHRNMQKNDQNREIYDSKKVCELHD
jgi:hypothetical protein